MNDKMVLFIWITHYEPWVLPIRHRCSLLQHATDLWVFDRCTQKYWHIFNLCKWKVVIFSKTTLDLCPHQLGELWEERTRLPVLFVCFPGPSSLARDSKCFQQLCWTESAVHRGQTNPICFLYWGNWGTAISMFRNKSQLLLLSHRHNGWLFQNMPRCCISPFDTTQPTQKLKSCAITRKCPIVMHLPPPVLVFRLRS